MVYSPRLRKAVGAVRASLARIGVERQSPKFAQHGQHQPLPDAPLVLIACSGGRDSMALAAIGQIVCASLGVRCGAVVVDHQLQSESRQVAEQTAERCRKLGLDPVLVRAADVHDEGEGLEAAARAARYQQLCIAAHEQHAGCVLLAHTLDDQAETVLIGLLRGHGLDMVAGMPPLFIRDDMRFVRPLLELSRADTTGICQDLNLEYWDDPTNGEGMEGQLPNEYPLRSRVRHDLLPAIERFAGADVARHLANNARFLQMDKAYLDQQADMVQAKAVTITADHAHEGSMVVAINARMLEGEPASIRLRVLAHAFSEAAITVSAAHIEAVDRLITDWHGQSAVCLPSGYSANRKKHVIRVCQDRAHANR